MMHIIITSYPDMNAKQVWLASYGFDCEIVVQNFLLSEIVSCWARAAISLSYNWRFFLYWNMFELIYEIYFLIRMFSGNESSQNAYWSKLYESHLTCCKIAKSGMVQTGRVFCYRHSRIWSYVYTVQNGKIKSFYKGMDHHAYKILWWNVLFFGVQERS